METVKFTDIVPAKYNPRHLSEEAFEILQHSLKTLGFVLPIIVNKDNMTIVAGHQRTKAAKAVGLEEAPVFYVHGVDITSEIRFNQIHNGVENEPDMHDEFIGNYETDKFYEALPISDFVIKDSNATYVREMAELITRHGDALCAIACGNEVVFGNNYVKACQVLHIPVHCYVMDQSHRQEFEYYFAQNYGVFSYEHLERRDYVQGLAQPPRAAGVRWSVLYRKLVVPYLNENGDKAKTHILDFGCGKAMCIEKVRNLGYKKTVGLEFFNHNRVGISIEKGHDLINNFFDSVRKNGKFDVTICDAVVNSVNTQFAEDAVFTVLNLCTKMGGRVFVSGRRKEDVIAEMNAKKSSTGSVVRNFFDENGLTAFLQQGQWFYQKFLTKEQVDAIFDKFGFECVNRYRISGYWGFEAVKVKELPVEKYVDAVDYEFNLNLPNRQRYNRHEEAKQVLGLPYGQEC